MCEEIDPAIAEAIREGVNAGVFRRAARLNRSVQVWTTLANAHTAKVGRLLEVMTKRPELKTWPDGAARGKAHR